MRSAVRIEEDAHALPHCGFWSLLIMLCIVVLSDRRSSGRNQSLVVNGAIFLALPDASKDVVSGHANDRGNDQRHQQLNHGLCPIATLLKISLFALFAKGTCPNIAQQLGR